MKKWIVLLGITIGLTGCQSKYPDYMAYRMNRLLFPDRSESHKEYTVVSKTEDYFAQDLEFWEEVIGSDIETDWDRREVWHDQSINRLGGKNIDGAVQIFDINSLTDKPMIEVLSQKLGKEFDEFLKQVPKGDDYWFKEKVIENVGIILERDRFGTLGIYVVPSSIRAKDEADNKWIHDICGDDVVVSAVSVGQDKQLIELSYPSFLIRNSFTGLTNATSYFQLFRTNEGKLEKARMVVNQYIGGYKEGELDLEKLEPLQRIVNEFMEETVDMTDFTQDICSVLDQKSNKKVGRVGSLHYEILRGDTGIGYEKVVEVVITPQ